jgi:5'-3' exonuclease
MEKHKPTLLIWDSDGGIFRASYYVKDSQNLAGLLAAKKKLDSEMELILEKVQPDFFIAFHGKPGSDCFRNDIATIKPYKEARKNRSDTWSEYFKKPLKNHLRDKWGSMEMEFIEADDACGIALNKYHNDYNIVMVYEDHDFYQLGNQIGKDIVGYNPNKKQHTLVTKENSRYEWWLQCLTGCNGDSIVGIPGIGQDSKGERNSKGHAILAMRTGDSDEEYFEVIRQAYIKKYGELYLTFLLENYILLKMLDKPMFDFPKEITLQPYIKKQEAKHLKSLEDL